MPKTNPLIVLHNYGQSIWLDLLSRNLIRSGNLMRLIESDAVSGVTSNPAIFEKAIGHSPDYDDDIRRLSTDKSAQEIYRDLTVRDIQEAADLLHPIYLRTACQDGYVSLEVSPLLARDSQGTVREANELWREVHRSNVMIKIPATTEGLSAITEATAAGINVNVTLVFGLPRYREVADAYIRGIEQRIERGQDVRNMRSVASFFLSRIDVLTDTELDARARSGQLPSDKARALRGTAAIASAKLAYQIYKEIFSSQRFVRLQERGATKQWLLWGSTGTKSKEYSDVRYVEPLIGPETINTMPMETLEAYRDHGAPESRLERDVEDARKQMTALASADINIDEITQRLENEGIQKFVQPFEALMRTLDEKRRLRQAGSASGV